MNQIAFIWNNYNIYWSGILIAAGVLAAALAAIALRLLQGKCLDMLIFLPLATALGFLGGRLQHWYCFYRQYESLTQALTDDSVGSFCLTGAMGGVLLALILLCVLRVIREPKSFLDALTPAGALGISIGRLSAMFYSGDHGKVVFETEFLQRLPFSTPMEDATGTVSWRAAVFLWESAAAFLIFLLLLAVFIKTLRKPEPRKEGMVCHLFLLLYSGAEIILDSMRYDSAFFRSNGFVSIVQVIGMVIFVAQLCYFSVLAIRNWGLALRHVIRWILFLTGAGLTGYMEYYVQRHGDFYVICYSLMAVSVFLCWITILRFMRDGNTRREPELPRPENQEPEAE